MFDLEKGLGDAFKVRPFSFLATTMARPPSRRPKPAPKKAVPPKTTTAKKIAPHQKNGSGGPALPRLRENPLPVDQTVHKFVLQPFSPAAPEPELPAYEFLGELPESYGTRRLFLAARDLS